MSIPRFYGRTDLARYLGVSVTRIGQLNIPADAWAGDRPLWTPATASRLRIELEQRRAARIRGAKRVTSVTESPA